MTLDADWQAQTIILGQIETYQEEGTRTTSHRFGQK
jgi:hypothetical protein